MSLLLSILGIGLLLGMRHATDSDHVVAITTILAKEKKAHASTLIGILWGIGHSITVTLIGIPILLYSIVVPPRLGLALEFFVGVMLFVLGLLNLTGLMQKIHNKFSPIIVHNHEHLYPTGGPHKHFHMHTESHATKHIHHLGLFQSLRPFAIGLIHGLAGSAAIALLVLSTIKNTVLSVAYLFIFNIGVIIGMMILTTILGTSITLAKKKSDKIHTYLVTASGLFSLFFGLYLMYQLGVVDGLFSGTVHWTPE